MRSIPQLNLRSALNKFPRKDLQGKLNNAGRQKLCEMQSVEMLGNFCARLEACAV